MNFIQKLKNSLGKKRKKKDELEEKMFSASEYLDELKSDEIEEVKEVKRKEVLVKYMELKDEKDEKKIIREIKSGRKVLVVNFRPMELENKKVLKMTLFRLKKVAQRAKGSVCGMRPGVLIMVSSGIKIKK